MLGFALSLEAPSARGGIAAADALLLAAADQVATIADEAAAPALAAAERGRTSDGAIAASWIALTTAPRLAAPSGQRVRAPMAAGRAGGAITAPRAPPPAAVGR